MQGYTEIPSSQSLQSSLALLLNNDKTAISCSAGTVFPTTNLQLGMLCYRSDQNKTYRLTSVSPSSVWTLTLDHARVVAYADQIISLTNTTVTTALGYTPAKIDGTNATGTWGISISGNAATATTATAATTATTATTANALNSANTYSGTSFTASAGVYAAGGSGFYSSAYVTNARNPIWRFANSDASGISYFQGTAGISSVDTIGLHFGTATAAGSKFQFVSNGDMIAVGNVSAYSDESLKTNWRPVADNFVELLAEVKSGIYDRVDEDLTQAGISAQSLQKVLPETVRANHEGTLSVAYGNAAMVSAVELAKEVVELKKQLANLMAIVNTRMPR